MLVSHTVRDLLVEAELQLRQVTSEARLDAELLLAHVLEKPRTFLHINQLFTPTKEQVLFFYALLSRRRALEPIAYLLQRKEFWCHDFYVSRATLIPRPETETLIEIACSLFKADLPLSVVDLGTGCGAIALTLASLRPAWSITALDCSWDAITIAKKNAKSLALENIQWVVGDWCSPLKAASYDFIISNPPYLSEVEWPLYQADLAYEPYQALVSGKEGMDALLSIAESGTSLLKKGGYLLFEHGYQQGSQVRDMLSRLGFVDIETRKDLSGHERATWGRLIKGCLDE